MGSVYLPVKVALLIILTLGLVFAITNLAPEIQRSRMNTNFVILSVIQIVILVVGLIGSYQDTRQYLIIYSIAMMILIVLGVIRSQAIEIVSNAVLDLVSIFLALWQGEMIRTGSL